MNDRHLELVRDLPHARETVFAAWAQPHHLAAWMGPSAAIQACDVKVDLRVGGAYQIAFEEPGQPRKMVRGIYQTVRPPEELAFTWIWDVPELGLEVVTLVQVTFETTETGTRLRILHHRFDSDHALELHRDGWKGTIDKLSDYLRRQA